MSLPLYYIINYQIFFIKNNLEEFKKISYVYLSHLYIFLDLYYTFRFNIIVNK